MGALDDMTPSIRALEAEADELEERARAFRQAATRLRELAADMDGPTPTIRQGAALLQELAARAAPAPQASE